MNLPRYTLPALAVLTLFSTNALATYCSLETPQFCPKDTAANTATATAAPSTSNATVAPSTSSANGSQGQSQLQDLTGGNVTGGNTTGGTTQSAVTSSYRSTSASLLFPAPIQGVPLPPIRCRNETGGDAWVWSFYSGQKARSDVDGLCQAYDIAVYYNSRCQFLNAATLFNSAVVANYKDVTVDIPAGTLNYPPTQCRDGIAYVPVSEPAKVDPPKVVEPAKTPEKVRVKDTITLDARTLFATDKSELTAEGLSALLDLGVKLKGLDELTALEVVGHTDSTASAKYNQGLSERRAASVGAALAAMGIQSTKITTRGEGLRSPVASNATADGRQQNRRVEIKVNGVKIIEKAQ